jgi:acetolactate synthase-1/2/3 large subunit
VRGRRPIPSCAAESARGHDAVRKDWIEQRSVDRVTPFVLLDALQKEFGPSAVFTADSGNGTFLAMECLRLERPGRFLAPVDYSCMGYSVPAAIGAGLGKPERRSSRWPETERF